MSFVRHDTQVAILERLLVHVDAKTTQLAETDSRISVSNYTSPDRLAEEHRVLFRKRPLVVAHVSEIQKPGDFVTYDVCGVPILVTRDEGGAVRAFLNVCRHRGTKLVPDDCGHKKAFACRYHAWTYDLRGALVHVPVKEAFPSLDCERTGLVALPSACAGGFVWVVPSPGAALDMNAWLGLFGDDLDAFGLASHTVHRRVRERRACNWKLVVDAFLEGYHVKSLHRDTIHRFFTESSISETFGPHVRSAGARKTILEARATPREDWDIRRYATVFYLLFPNTVLVFHPDWVSVLTLLPDGTDHAIYTHAMLVPSEPRTDEERAHWTKTFDLIEGNVFQKQDLAISESVAETLRSGADERFRLGRLEDGIRHFHESIDRALTEA